MPQDIVEDISDCGKDGNMPTEELGSQNPLNRASAWNANIEESKKIGKGGLINEEASVESLQEAAQETETDHLSREREISSPDEQSHIVNLEGNKDDSKEEIAAHETTLEGEILKDKVRIKPITIWIVTCLVCALHELLCFPDASITIHYNIWVGC